MLCFVELELTYDWFSVILKLNRSGKSNGKRDVLVPALGGFLSPKVYTPWFFLSLESTSNHHMSNRRERRAQARANATTKNEVPLRQPSRDAPNHKTLLDIASERQILNTASQSSYPSITTTKINPDGSLSTTSSASEVPDTTTSYLDILLYTATLTMLHFTLTLLVHHQYATTPPSLGSILYTSSVASPTPALILLLVSILHPRSSQLFAQILFAFLSVAAGAWLVHASNEDAYMAVMKKAPPLGTLWVWSIVEMRWEWAVGCLGVVAGWGWWKGYSMF